MLTLTVSSVKKDGTCFPTITQALAHIPAAFAEPVTILVEPGIYYEKIT